ncbi:FAD-dependent oxidoreductase [Gryllotalpicola sp.]|uniref:NAD(P)/FAD-dependent oxidoreductase n=1 Tax=Gryllotalpicola sp. TaxID=1932787 RepID=UPI0026057AEF|nr:FAD-dependent oxidoreductase [Gryllotalpicola sp.]
MASERMVIVGGGLAAASAAEQLREEGFDGEIVLVAGESHVPYLRPPLSKEFLGDLAASEESTWIQPPSWYDDRAIDLRVGVAATALDLAARTVALDDGAVLGYDAVLLATGASARALGVPGADASGIRYLRTLEDSAGLRADLASGGRQVVIVGSGWIGMEVAAHARSYGNDVTVVGHSAVPLESGVGAELGAFYAGVHAGHGVTFVNGTRVTGVDSRGGQVTGVQTDSGAIAADLVIVGAGAPPNTGLAEDAGLAVENGILVDEHLQAAPGVLAAGDVANPIHPVLGARLRSEHWANAIDGGRIAARNMLGHGAVLDKVPYFYSDQYDVGMEYAGYLPLTHGVPAIIRGSLESAEFVAFWVAGGRLVAGMNVNVWDVNESIQALIASGAPVDAAKLADPDVPLDAIAE